jgi:hypothetical protein
MKRLREWLRRVSHSDAGAASLVLIVCTAAYLANPWHRFTGDTVPARLIPQSLLQSGTLDLSSHPLAHNPDIAYAFIRRDGRIFSAYPIGTPLLAVPFFVGMCGEIDSLRRERLSAAVLAALSAMLVVLVARRLGAARWHAVALGFVYGLCTATWSVSSQLLWQHTGGQLCNAVALLAVLVAGRSLGWWAVAGCAAGMAVVCRPTNAVVVAAFGVVALLRGRHCALSFFAGVAPFAVGLVWYNLSIAGHIAGGYAPYSGRVWETVAQGRWLEHLAGLLLSPGRGLLIYTPVVVWSVLESVRSVRSGIRPETAACASIITAYVLLTSLWFNWWGGYSYGPRLLADMLPFAAALAVPVVTRPVSRWVRLAMVLTVAWSGVVQSGGVYRDTGRWNADPPIDRTPERLWSWRYSPLVAVLSDNRVPPVPPPYRDELETSVDFREPRARRYAGYGWVPTAEPWGRWMDGTAAEVYLAVSTRAAHVLHVRAIAPEGLPAWPQCITVSVNGMEVGRCTIERPEQWVGASWSVPAAVLTGDVERVQFRCTQMRSRWGRFPADPRRLSAGFDTVRLLPAP